MQDSYRAKGLRKKLSDEVRLKGIKDERIIAAINTIPRHLFIDSGFMNHAYIDKAFPIGAGQTISQPYTVAFQTELLQVEKRMKVLEVGTGSGYQAAVLLEMGAKVFTIERQRELYLKTQSFLPQLGYKASFHYGDGYKGLPSYAPFDRIIVTAGANEIPQELLKQLKVGGRMVIPVGNEDVQKMILLEKVTDAEIRKSIHGNFVFVPLLPGTENK